VWLLVICVECERRIGRRDGSCTRAKIAKTCDEPIIVSALSQPTMAAASSLRELRAPEADEDEDSTWDSTFQRELFRKSAIGSASICPHAVSVGRRVYGIDARKPQEQCDEQWWSWQRSLAEEALDQKSSSSNPVGLVNCITSNTDGTVIVAATDAGIVSLMRGSDGQVLATRKVCSENIAAIINLTWIAGEDEDVLLIEAPSDDDGPSNLILVSNIRGDRLNHPNSTIVAEAARNMQILPLSLEGSYEGDSRDLRAITGCFQDKTIIRLVACDCDGKLVVHDYNRLEKIVCFVKKCDIGLGGLDDPAEWLIDFDVGLHTQSKDDKSFALCTAFSNQAPPMLFWFDLSALQTACQFELPHAATSSSTKVIAMETVSSFSASDTLAVAVAVKSSMEGTSSSLGTIHVIQVLLDETMGLTVLRNPHVVYSIPTENATISMALACIPSIDLSSAPYSFRCKLWRSGQDDCVYKIFEPNVLTSSTIGKIRSLLWRGEFDQADEIVARVGVAALVRDKYANFHPSEIALHRLKYSLAQGSPDAMEQAQLCLRRLASGAVSGSETGLELLLEAVNSVIKSPSNLSLESFVIGLTTVASTIQTVLKSIPTENSEKLRSKEEAIVQQIYALEFISVANATTPGYALSTPFHTIRSPRQLYSVLVTEHKFGLAETLYRSNLREQLTAEALLVPLLKLDANVKPHDYVSLLSDVVFPNLAINDHLLPRLKSWCCRVADSLDDINKEKLDLDAALVLLQVRAFSVCRSYLYQDMPILTMLSSFP
jgi:hypothetical protein